jgi:excisionase family DNA binding protein
MANHRNLIGMVPMKEKNREEISEREQARRKSQSAADRAAWSIKDGAHRIGVGKSTIYKLASEGKIRLVKVAGRTLIPDAEIVRIVNGEAE